MMSERPLDGIRVVEVGQLIAGPFAGTMLGYFGADVIKIEPPGRGDPLRGWRHLDRGTSYWWRSIGRNKRSVAVDLRKAEGREILRRLLEEADVLIENFRPGVMEEWGLGPDDLKASNPSLVYCRVSGYGQTGPYRRRPGYASVCEGVGGFRYVNGMPGNPPVRPNLSMGDTVAGLHAVIGVLLALVHRGKVGEGQTVDVAIYESVFNLMEGVIPEFSGAGVVREPSGTTITGIVPTNTYLCADGRHVIIGGNGTSIYQRLMTAAGRQDLAHDPELQTNAGRVARVDEVDGAIAVWCRGRTSDEVLTCLEQARVPSGPIYSVQDMSSDPHFRARELFEEVEVDGKTMEVPALLPKLQGTPGRTDWPGASHGAHTRAVLESELGLTGDALDALEQAGVIQSS